MKKILVSFVVGLLIVSCNNETTTETNITDSVVPGNHDNSLDTMHLHHDTTARTDNTRADSAR